LTACVAVRAPIHAPGSSGPAPVGPPLFRIGGLPFGLQVLGFLERDADLFGGAAALRAAS